MYDVCICTQPLFYALREYLECFNMGHQCRLLGKIVRYPTTRFDPHYERTLHQIMSQEETQKTSCESFCWIRNSFGS